MIIRFKHFHDNLNIVVILTPGCEIFCGKYAQFSEHLQNEIKQRTFFFRNCYH